MKAEMQLITEKVTSALDSVAYMQIRRRKTLKPPIPVFDKQSSQPC